MTSAITGHGDHDALNGRLDLLTVTVDEFVEELYTQLHRTADGGPPRAPPAEYGGGRNHEMTGWVMALGDETGWPVRTTTHLVAAQSTRTPVTIRCRR
jgi:hypothetical protein